MLQIALASLERRDAPGRESGKGLFPAAPGMYAGEDVKNGPAACQTHSGSPSLLHDAAAQPASFLFFFFFRRRQPKLREVWGSRVGKGTLRSDLSYPYMGDI